MFVSAWAPFGGAQPVVVVSKTRWRLLPTYPRGGTFLHAAGRSSFYRMSGGVASFIPSWDAFGGPQPATDVDPAALDKAGSGGVWNHLISSKPSVSMTGPGTLVTTRPSASATWTNPVLSSSIKQLRRPLSVGQVERSVQLLGAAGLVGTQPLEVAVGAPQARLRLLRVGPGPQLGQAGDRLDHEALPHPPSRRPCVERLVRLEVRDRLGLSRATPTPVRRPRAPRCAQPPRRSGGSASSRRPVRRAARSR